VPSCLSLHYHLRFGDPHPQPEWRWATSGGVISGLHLRPLDLKPLHTMSFFPIPCPVFLRLPLIFGCLRAHGGAVGADGGQDRETEYREGHVQTPEDSSRSSCNRVEQTCDASCFRQVCCCLSWLVFGSFIGHCAVPAFPTSSKRRRTSLCSAMRYAVAASRQTAGSLVKEDADAPCGGPP
jgi:hypothetical protein